MGVDGDDFTDPAFGDDASDPLMLRMEPVHEAFHQVHSGGPASRYGLSRLLSVQPERLFA